MTKIHTNWTIDEKLVADLKKKCGSLIPVSRYVEEIIRENLAGDEKK